VSKITRANHQMFLGAESPGSPMRFENNPLP